MKYKELAGMGKTELEEKLSQLRMDMIKANAQIATGTTPKNPGQIRQTKKTIARIKQLLKIKAEEKSNE